MKPVVGFNDYVDWMEDFASACGWPWGQGKGWVSSGEAESSEVPKHGISWAYNGAFGHIEYKTDSSQWPLGTFRVLEDG